MSNYPAPTAPSQQSPVVAAISNIRSISEELKKDALSLEQAFGNVLDDTPKPEPDGGLNKAREGGSPIGSSLVERDLLAATKVMLEAKEILSRMRNNCRV